MKNRFFNMNLAGGALLDIGVYALSIARSFMSSQPDQVLSQVKYAPTGADEQEGILLMNPDGQMAALSLSLHSKQPKRAVISCEKGYIGDHGISARRPCYRCGSRDRKGA